MEKIDLSAFIEAWPAPYVERQLLREFSGGMLNSRTMANLDSKGNGVPGRFKVGRKVMYPVDELVAWMEARAERPGHPGKIGGHKDRRVQS